jgi:hypothetical protein
VPAVGKEKETLLGDGLLKELKGIDEEQLPEVVE